MELETVYELVADWIDGGNVDGDDKVILKDEDGELYAGTFAGIPEEFWGRKVNGYSKVCQSPNKKEVGTRILEI